MRPMTVIDPSKIACFQCVEIVHAYIDEGVQHVSCPSCNRRAPMEKALDDCFVFLVASAIGSRFPTDLRRTYGFMPLQRSRLDTMKDRALMLETGRALKAA